MQLYVEVNLDNRTDRYGGPASGFSRIVEVNSMQIFRTPVLYVRSSDRLPYIVI